MLGATPQIDVRDLLAIWKDTWEEGCVWQPWASEADPVGGLEIDLIWRGAPLDSDCSPKALDDHYGSEWRLHVLTAERSAKTSWQLFRSTQSVRRQHLRLPLFHDVLSGKEWGSMLFDDKKSLTTRC